MFSKDKRRITLPILAVLACLCLSQLLADGVAVHSAQQVEPEFFLDPTIEKNYSEKDYHRIYLGEVVAITGTANYRKA